MGGSLSEVRREISYVFQWGSVLEGKCLLTLRREKSSLQSVGFVVVERYCVGIDR